MSRSVEFRTKLGRRVYDALQAEADEWDMALTDFVRYILTDYVRKAEQKPAPAKEKPQPFIPFGA